MGSGNSPPLGSKPKSAVPSYLLNGTSSVRMPSNVREREDLNSSIKTSFARKQVIDAEASKEKTGLAAEVGDLNIRNDDEGSNNASAAPSQKRNFSEPPRDPRDEGTITPSRPASPFTLNPPIDFDGLSWPST